MAEKAEPMTTPMPGRPESRDGEGSSSGRDESVPDGSVAQGASSKAEKPTAQLRDGQIDDVPSNGFLRFFSRMGNLPQWKWRGQLLRGAALNW
jgi:hypothetical protein